MRLLMLSPLCPWPANNGAVVRISQLFKSLRQHHTVTLVAPGPRATAANAANDVTPDGVIFVPPATPRTRLTVSHWR
jgi:hypothetical protein